MDTYRVGSNIDSFCTKCRLFLAHTIEAIDANEIKRVKCNTCRGQHRFRAKDNKNIIKVVPSAYKKTLSTSVDMDRLLSGKDLNQAKDYDPSKKYVKDELLRHNQFGLGIVIVERDAKKIEVLFKSGPKILIHAMHI